VEYVSSVGEQTFVFRQGSDMASFLEIAHPGQGVHLRYGRVYPRNTRTASAWVDLRPDENAVASKEWSSIRRINTKGGTSEVRSDKYHRHRPDDSIRLTEAGREYFGPQGKGNGKCFQWKILVKPLLDGYLSLDVPA